MKLENNFESEQMEVSPGIKDLLLRSELQLLPAQSNQYVIQNLVKRMTRFFVNKDHDIIIKRIIEFAIFEKYNYQIEDDHTIEILTLDRRKEPLVFKANIIKLSCHGMNDKILVDVRLSRGCGLEFKRHFNKFKLALDDITMKEFTRSWLERQ